MEDRQEQLIRLIVKSLWAAGGLSKNTHVHTTIRRASKRAKRWRHDDPEITQWARAAWNSARILSAKEGGLDTTMTLGQLAAWIAGYALHNIPLPQHLADRLRVALAQHPPNSGDFGSLAKSVMAEELGIDEFEVNSQRHGSSNDAKPFYDCDAAFAGRLARPFGSIRLPDFAMLTADTIKPAELVNVVLSHIRVRDDENFSASVEFVITALIKVLREWPDQMHRIQMSFADAGQVVRRAHASGMLSFVNGMDGNRSNNLSEVFGNGDEIWSILAAGCVQGYRLRSGDKREQSNQCAERLMQDFGQKLRREYQTINAYLAMTFVWPGEDDEPQDKTSAA